MARRRMSTGTMLSACGKSKIYRMILESLDDGYGKRRRWVHQAPAAELQMLTM